MALRRVGALDEYARALRDDPGEARALAQDMLIHVTSFFRDPEAFEALQEQVFQELAQRKGEGGSIRIWVPGCSTGEEVYSLAICLLESLDALAESFSIKVFGTDLSDEAIETARLGLYSESALADVAPERLSRFFERVEGGYRIGKRIRDLVRLREARPHPRPALRQARPHQLPQRAHLLRRRAAAPGHPDAALLPEQAGLPVPGAERDDHRVPGSLRARGQGTPDLREDRGEPAARLSPPGRSRGRGEAVARASLAERRHPAREAQRQADHLLLARYAPPGVHRERPAGDHPVPRADRRLPRAAARPAPGERAEDGARGSGGSPARGDRARARRSPRRSARRGCESRLAPRPGS